MTDMLVYNSETPSAAKAPRKKTLKVLYPVFPESIQYSQEDKGIVLVLNSKEARELIECLRFATNLRKKKRSWEDLLDQLENEASVY